MARALMGHVGSPGDRTLAVEVARLRRRVRELEIEVAQLRAQNSAASAATAELSVELHRMTEAAEPALA